eukprot:gene19945-21898_t
MEGKRKSESGGASKDLPESSPKESKPEACKSGETADGEEASGHEDGGGEEKTEGADLLMEILLQRMKQSLGIFEDEEPHPPVLEDFTLSGIAQYIKSNECKNIIVMTGAGISTSAGIPDFRSPESGLYHNLEKYNLPSPESIFQLEYFLENPEPFFMLAKELYPGNFKPTPSHYFIKLLADKNMLLRSFTQNIDGLEIVAGVSPDLVVAAHGTFHSAHCVNCKKEYSEEWEKERIFRDETPKCEDCSGIVKPDIVFFGESLPERFFKLSQSDFPKCDLLIVMGTSLVVQPFASMIDRVTKTTPRLLINKEKRGESSWMGGFDFSSEKRYRDVAYLSTCDDGCFELAKLLGLEDDLNQLIGDNNKESEKKQMKKAPSESKKTTAAKK